MSEIQAPAAGLAAALDPNACAVKLSAFEGPLDLLLHLIRMNELDVTDLPIAEIAQQYVAYVDLMHELNLDVAAEYLVMAATLAWIKSRMLLPPTEGEGDEDEGVDPRAELVARLLEYQRFKEVADQLGDRSLEGRDVFAARGLEPQPTPEAERELEVSVLALLEAFRRVLDRAKRYGGLHEVETEHVTVHERMIAVMDALRGQESIEFEQLFASLGERPSRALLVTSFLAVLELVRIAALRVYQGLGGDGVPAGPIRLRAGPASEIWNERIAEIM
jgi:segregation and condensation protein A